MALDHITDLDQLRKINKALLNRVESAMDQQGNAFSLFQTTIHLEGQVKRRTDELTLALHNIENKNLELAQAKETSDRANLSKTKFLAAASHDILQPLNAALLSISVLADMQESELGQNLANQIERSLDTMSELIHTLIDISKLDAGAVEPRYEVFPLSHLSESLQSDFMPIAKERGLKLKIVGNHQLPIQSDKTMLRRILQNLVSNALRYTSTGGVLVGAIQRQDCVCIQVVDTGCGVPEDQHDNIFEEFNRGALPSGHQRDANQGLGLGLSIVKRMAKAMGHKLEMKSVVGSGTRFILKIPLCTVDKNAPSNQAPIPHALSAPNFASKRVLLIENDPVSIDAMTLLLESWDCETRVASNLEETTRQISDTNWIPDVIIADQHLDHGDLGTQAIILVRQTIGQYIPALLVTADPAKSLDKSIKALNTEMMKKPVKPAQLRALLSHLITNHPT